MFSAYYSILVTQSIRMKKLLFLFFCCCFSSLLFAQSATDNQLNERLNTYMKLNRDQKFSELMNYLHPSIFSLVPKEKLAEVFEQSFDNDEIRISIDSTGITGISPVFKHQNSSYHYITYYMEMALHLKDSSAMENEEQIEFMNTSLKEGFPDGSVNYNKEKKAFLINGSNIMLAIKDATNPQWMFLGVEKKNPAMLKKLVPAAVINHFKIL